MSSVIKFDYPSDVWVVPRVAADEPLRGEGTLTVGGKSADGNGTVLIDDVVTWSGHPTEQNPTGSRYFVVNPATLATALL
jgi:hypothetical protein